MSYLAGFDDGDSVQIASNKGYDNFVGWAKKLDAEEYPTVVHLVEHGWEDDIAGLKKQLTAAIGETDPDLEIKGIARGIATAVNGKGAVVISQGFEGGKESKSFDPWQY